MGNAATGPTFNARVKGRRYDACPCTRPAGSPDWRRGHIGELRRVGDISHAPMPGQESDVAQSFTISGLAEPPRVTLNGRPAEVRAAGQAFQISLA